MTRQPGEWCTATSRPSRRLDRHSGRGRRSTGLLARNRTFPGLISFGTQTAGRGTTTVATPFGTTLLLLVAALVVFSGCPEKESAPDKPSKSAAELLAEALVGPGDECKAHGDCASDVCQDGFCSALSEASQPWMEARIARKLRNTPGAVEALLDTWVSRFESEDPFARGRLAGVLGHLNDKRAIPLLQAWAKSPIERLRVRATLALGRMGDDATWGAIEGLLDHRSESVALDATDTLINYGRSGAHRDDALGLLVELADDPRYRMRQSAVRAIGEVGRRTPQVVTLLEELSNADADGYLAHDARRALSLCK